MNTRQIDTILRHVPYTRGTFQGVYPSDRLPLIIERYPAAFVANVDPHDRPGSHWCAFYFTGDQYGEFFDSYGRKPEDVSLQFKHFLVNNSKYWTYNPKPLQSLTSNVCGHYCLYFILHRCKRMSLKTIVSRFTQNYTKNDRFVYYSIVRHFGNFIQRIKRLVTHQSSIQHNKQYF